MNVTLMLGTNFSLSYIDDYNVSHRLAGTAACRAAISWDEGIAGWINSAQFDICYCKIELRCIWKCVFKCNSFIRGALSNEE